MTRICPVFALANETMRHISGSFRVLLLLLLLQERHEQVALCLPDTPF